MPAWHTIAVPDARPIIASTLFGLGSGSYDGQIGIIRIGSGVDAFSEIFVWDSTARSGSGGWVGQSEHIVMTCDDAWALDWTRQPLSAVRNVWSRPNGGVGWARSGAAAILRTDITIPTNGSSFALDIHLYGASSLPSQGNLTIRGNTFVYTGISIPQTTVSGAHAANATTINLVSTTGMPTSGYMAIGNENVSYAAISGNSITGCGSHVAYVGGEPANAARITGVTLQFGTGGVTYKGAPIYTNSPTPIIPYAPVLGGGGDPGGWGTTVIPLDHVGEMWAAGFRLQERMHAWMNGSQDFKSLQIAPWYINYDLNEDFSYPGLSAPPPSGLLGPGQTLLGVADPMAGIISGGGGAVIDERRFKWVEGSWSSWVAAAPLKRVLIPVLYGIMPADANDTGQAYGVTLSLRWVQP